ncbi:MAG: hypothetical protein OEY94_09855 [Alphaproteobacteria bacterium]|nr:hypothetical protein [Alphaproteobacteria bacterium]
MSQTYKQPHRQKRGNIYYFRIAVPCKLQTVLGYEYKCSLRTGDKQTASYLCRVMNNKAEYFFQMVMLRKPTETDLKKIMRGYFEKQLEQAMAEYAQARGMFYGSEDEISEAVMSD